MADCRAGPVVSSLTASKICDGCGSDVPDVAVRWRCDECDFDCCLACGSFLQGDELSTSVEYDLPPAEGESQVESNRRRDRHRKREEAAIRDREREIFTNLRYSRSAIVP